MVAGAHLIEYTELNVIYSNNLIKYSDSRR